MRKIIFVIGSLSLLAACGPVDTPSEGFGDAVRQNLAAQIINPQPYQAGAAPPEENDGARASGAMQRYRDGKVIRPSNAAASGGLSGGSQ